jgi:hypothetical protein
MTNFSLVYKGEDMTSPETSDEKQWILDRIFRKEGNSKEDGEW